MANAVALVIVVGAITRTVRKHNFWPHTHHFPVWTNPDSCSIYVSILHVPARRRCMMPEFSRFDDTHGFVKQLVVEVPYA